MTLQYEQDIPKKNLLDKSLSYIVSLLSRERDKTTENIMYISSDTICM